MGVGVCACVFGSILVAMSDCFFLTLCGQLTSHSRGTSDIALIATYWPGMVIAGSFLGSVMFVFIFANISLLRAEIILKHVAGS